MYSFDDALHPLDGTIHFVVNHGINLIFQLEYFGSRLANALIDGLVDFQSATFTSMAVYS